MNTDSIDVGRPLSLCSAYNCRVRETCLRYREFSSIIIGAARGRWFVCTSGTLGAKCPRYVPTEKAEPRKDTNCQ